MGLTRQGADKLDFRYMHFAKLYRPFLNTFLIVKTLEIYKEFLVGLQKEVVFFLNFGKKRGMDQILEYIFEKKKN